MMPAPQATTAPTGFLVRSAESTEHALTACRGQGRASDFAGAVEASPLPRVIVTATGRSPLADIGQRNTLAGPFGHSFARCQAPVTVSAASPTPNAATRPRHRRHAPGEPAGHPRAPAPPPARRAFRVAEQGHQRTSAADIAASPISTRWHRPCR